MNQNTEISWCFEPWISLRSCSKFLHDRSGGLSLSNDQFDFMESNVSNAIYTQGPCWSLCAESFFWSGGTEGREIVSTTPGYLISMNYKPENMTSIFDVRNYYSQFETINLGHQKVPKNDLEIDYVSKWASVIENQIVGQIGASYFGFWWKHDIWYICVMPLQRILDIGRGIFASLLMLFGLGGAKCPLPIPEEFC